MQLYTSRLYTNLCKEQWQKIEILQWASCLPSWVLDNCSIIIEIWPLQHWRNVRCIIFETHTACLINSNLNPLDMQSIKCQYLYAIAKCAYLWKTAITAKSQYFLKPLPEIKWCTVCMEHYFLQCVFYIAAFLSAFNCRCNETA